jgi:hypothetical protein
MILRSHRRRLRIPVDVISIVIIGSGDHDRVRRGSILVGR